MKTCCMLRSNRALGPDSSRRGSSPGALECRRCPEQCWQCQTMLSLWGPATARAPSASALLAVWGASLCALWTGSSVGWCARGRPLAACRSSAHNRLIKATARGTKVCRRGRATACALLTGHSRGVLCANSGCDNTALMTCSCSESAASNTCWPALLQCCGRLPKVRHKVLQVTRLLCS